MKIKRIQDMKTQNNLLRRQFENYMEKEIYYWSPFLGRVATIRSVVNSMIGLKMYRGKHYKIKLINCYGEWNILKSYLKSLNNAQ